MIVVDRILRKRRHWHRWFAWRPVRSHYTRKWVWLKVIRRSYGPDVWGRWSVWYDEKMVGTGGGSMIEGKP